MKRTTSRDDLDRLILSVERMELFIFSGGWDKVIFENGEGKIFQKYNLSESEKSPINFFQKTILDKKRGKSKLQVPTSAWGRAKNRWKNFPGVKTRGAGGERDAGASRTSTECVAGDRVRRGA